MKNKLILLLCMLFCVKNTIKSLTFIIKYMNDKQTTLVIKSKNISLFTNKQAILEIEPKNILLFTVNYKQLKLQTLQIK
jgi:hypothetical protein